MKKIFYSLLLISIAGAACSSDESGGTNRGGNRFGGAPGQRGNPEFAEAVSVKAYQATRMPISTYLLSNTTLESIRKVTIVSKINAIVEEILVEEGSRVRNGQLLAKLDEREIRNEFNQAQIALEQSEVALEQARVKALLSKANYERNLSLLEQKLISQQEFDQAALTNQTDQLALEAAQRQVSANRARLEAAQIQLDYTQITSSIDGTVTERLVDVGSRVSANQAVFTVEDFTPLWARIFLPEKELPRLKISQLAELRLQAFPNRTFPARIKMISPTVDASSGTVKVTLEINQGLDVLRPGMFGTAYIATETHPDAIVIPKRAVLRERDENRVFVIGSNNSVEKREVQLGFSEEDRFEVIAGLQPGEAVVTVGQEGLSDGYPVEVLEWENAPPGTMPSTSASVEQAQSRQPQPANGPPAQPATESAPEGADEQANRRPGGRGGFRGDPAQMQAFLDRMLQNPEIKKVYDEELAKDPDFLQDPEKRRAFFMKIRQHMRPGR